MKKRTLWILCASLFVFAIAADLITKSWAETALSGGRVIPVLGNWLVFCFTVNTGGAFGSLAGSNVLFFIVTLIGLPAFGFWLYRSSKEGSVLNCISITMILAGALGNAYDRAFLGDGFFNGAVRDFISVSGFSVFNVADSFLTVGVILLMFGVFFWNKDALIPLRKNRGENDGNGEGN